MEKKRKYRQLKLSFPLSPLRRTPHSRVGIFHRLSDILKRWPRCVAVVGPKHCGKTYMIKCVLESMGITYSDVSVQDDTSISFKKLSEVGFHQRRCILLSDVITANRTAIVELMGLCTASSPNAHRHTLIIIVPTPLPRKVAWVSKLEHFVEVPALSSQDVKYILTESIAPKLCICPDLLEVAAPYITDSRAIDRFCSLISIRGVKNMNKQDCISFAQQTLLNAKGNVFQICSDAFGGSSLDLEPTEYADINMLSMMVFENYTDRCRTVEEALSCVEYISDGDYISADRDPADDVGKVISFSAAQKTSMKRMSIRLPRMVTKKNNSKLSFKDVMKRNFPY